MVEEQLRNNSEAGENKLNTSAALLWLVPRCAKASEYHLMRHRNGRKCSSTNSDFIENNQSHPNWSLKSPKQYPKLNHAKIYSQ
jgi:hypothetical protein